MDIQELKEALKLIEKEKEAKAKEQEKEESQLNELMEKLVEKTAKAVISAANEAKKEKPKSGDPEELDKEEKIKAFFKAVLDGDKAHAKALAEGVDASGGYLVPDEFRADIVDWAQDKPVIRRFATVWPMAGKLLELPALAADVAVYWGSENTSISTTSADFGNVQLTAKKLNAIIYLSTELFEDSAIDLVPYLTDRFAQAIYREEDHKFVTGSGSGEPTGLSQASISSESAGGTGDADDIINAYWRLPQSHRENGVWLASNLTLLNISKLKDSDGRYLLVDPRDGGLPRLMGRPVLEQNDCGNTVYFGDLRFYYIGDRRQMSVKTTTEGAGTFEKDQVAIKVTERVDGVTALTRAFRKITNW